MGGKAGHSGLTRPLKERQLPLTPSSLCIPAASVKDFCQLLCCQFDKRNGLGWMRLARPLCTQQSTFLHSIIAAKNPKPQRESPAEMYQKRRAFWESLKGRDRESLTYYRHERAAYPVNTFAFLSRLDTLSHLLYAFFVTLQLSV